MNAWWNQQMPTGLPQLWNPLSFYGLGGLGIGMGLGGPKQSPVNQSFFPNRRTQAGSQPSVLDPLQPDGQPAPPPGYGLAPSIPIPAGQFLPGQQPEEYMMPSWAVEMPTPAAGDLTALYTGPTQYFGGSDPNWAKSLKPKRPLKPGEEFLAIG